MTVSPHIVEFANAMSELAEDEANRRGLTGGDFACSAALFAANIAVSNAHPGHEEMVVDLAIALIRQEAPALIASKRQEYVGQA